MANKDKVFGHRFKMCRMLAGFDTVSSAAEATGLNKSSISDYENDKRLPLLPAIIAMAETYDVSADFLLGRTDTTEHQGRTISL